MEELMELPPFKIVALAPFCPGREEKEVVTAGREDLDGALKALKPSFFISTPGEKDIMLEVKSLRGFHPDGLLRDQEALSSLRDAKQLALSLQGEGKDPSAIVEEINLRYGLGLRPPRKREGKPKGGGGTIEQLLQMVALPEGEVRGEQAVTDQIDQLVTKQLQRVFSHEPFRKAEASWRGLRFLLEGADPMGIPVEAMLVHIDRVEDLPGLLGELFPQILNYDPSLLVVDLPFSSSSKDLEGAKKVAEVAELLLCPALIWIDHRFFHLRGWEELQSLPFLPHLMEEPEYAKWRSFRESPEARWLAIGCNRFLLRYPYGPENPPRLSPFDEGGRYLWGAPVWAIGRLILESLRETGWPTHISGRKVGDLALRPQGGGLFPLEVMLSEDRAWQMGKLNLMPLLGIVNKDVLFCASDTTLSGEPLSYQLLTSRVVHFLLEAKKRAKAEVSSLEEGGRFLIREINSLWEKSSSSRPEALEITPGQTSEGRPLLKIALYPDRKSLPYSRPLELDLPW